MVTDNEKFRTWIVIQTDWEGVQEDCWKTEQPTAFMPDYIKKLIDNDFKEYNESCSTAQEKQECANKLEQAEKTIVMSSNQISGDSRCCDNFGESCGYKYIAIALDSLKAI